MEVKTLGELSYEEVEKICEQHTISYLDIDPFQGKNHVIKSKCCENCQIFDIIATLGLVAHGDCSTIIAAINGYKKNKTLINKILKQKIEQGEINK